MLLEELINILLECSKTEKFLLKHQKSCCFNTIGWMTLPFRMLLASFHYTLLIHKYS